MRLSDWFRIGKFSRGQRVLVHDGPGGPLKLAELQDRVSGPDSRGIEVWWLEYVHRPGVRQKRALPCQCEECK